MNKQKMDPENFTYNLTFDLGRVLWASAAQLMSQQGAKSLKEVTTSTYVV
jgi:hypothetical protein